MIPLATAAVALALGAASPASARPTADAGRLTSGSGAASATALAAANTLIALPWRGLAAQRKADLTRELEKLEGDYLAKGSGGGSLRWSFGLKIDDVKPRIDLAQPPGIREASLDGFAVAAPLTGSWALGTTLDLAASAKVSLFGQKVFSWKGSRSLGIVLEDIRAEAAASLDPSEADRPLLRSARSAIGFWVKGTGILAPVLSVPVGLTGGVATAPFEGGKLTVSERLSGASVELGPLMGKLTADLRLVIEPDQQPYEVTGNEVTDVSLRVTATLDGSLSVKLDQVGRQEVPFSLTVRGRIPSFEQLNEALTLLAPPLPRAWGEDAEGAALDGGRPAAPAPGFDLAAVAAEIEAAIRPHTPYGAVLSLDAPHLGQLRGGYSIEADSAIWTGHYLAAEAFRYAATGTPEALARVEEVLAGLERLFEVTGDAVVAGGGRTAVRIGPGVLARTALPSTSQIGYTAGPLERRDCYYENPEGGWRLLGDRPSRTFATYAEAEKAAAESTGLRKIVPVGAVWRGWGCGDNRPVSKDQYIGAVLGLGVAYRLVPDPGVRSRVKKLVDDVLSYVGPRPPRSRGLGGNWNVTLPPDNRIAETSSFLGDFPKQLALLRVGKTVDPARWGGLYDAAAAAAPLTWLPVWFSSVDPLFQYYKFNLTHGAFVTLLFLEDDAGLRSAYRTGYDMLWRTVGHHRNAYFDLLHVLVQDPGARAAAAEAPGRSNPSLTLAREARSLLQEWVKRRDLVPGPNGLPRDDVAEPGYHAGLAPEATSVYLTLDGKQLCVADYALPVWGRLGKDLEFAWQKDPFLTGIPVAKCESQAAATLAELRQKVDESRESPGVDYLLPYWLGVYLGLLP